MSWYNNDVQHTYKIRNVLLNHVPSQCVCDLQGQQRTSNDGAESVEAKQEMSQGAQRGTAETGSNQDAESVTAKDGGSADDSGTEEGEIAGV